MIMIRATGEKKVTKKNAGILYRAGMSILNDDTEVEDSMQVTYINAYDGLR